MKNRIYLDNCCFNRPYDDQSYLTIYLESQAKLYVQGAILKGEFELAWSYILDYENSANSFKEHRDAIAKWRTLACVDIDASKEIVTHANEVMLIRASKIKMLCILPVQLKLIAIIS